MEITIKINPKSKQAKAFLEYLKVLPFVQIKEKDNSNYSPEFAAKLKKGEADIAKGKTTRLNPENVWENIL